MAYDTKMKKILLIGNSGGIGSTLQSAWTSRGCEVTGLSRSYHGFDITDEISVNRHLSKLNIQFDIIFIATGGLSAANSKPEKSLSDLTQLFLQKQFLLNAAGPALILKHSKKLLRKDVTTIVAVLSARVGSIGDNRLGGWYSYRASKAALNQIIHSAAIELKRSHPKSICVALHPGTVRTAMTEKYVGNNTSVSTDESANNLLRVINHLKQDQTGLFFDWAGQRIEW